jgi:hypothetical protein
VAAFLAHWVSRPELGRLLLTSRYPFDLPGCPALSNHHVGPLSWPEARKLMWHLRALDTLSVADQQKSYVDSGGHPRTLRILDALLRQPGGTLADLRQRTERLLRDRKIDRPDLWMAQVGKVGMDTSLAEAVTSAVYRGLLGDLVSALDEPVRAVLLDAAERQPVPAATLLASHANDPDNANDPHHADDVDDADRLDRAGAIAVLDRSGLLTRISAADGVSFVVDSDTIEVLASVPDPRRSRA